MWAQRGFDDSAIALSTLGWWELAGVDTIVDDAPRNWLKPVDLPPARSPAIPAAVSAPPADALPSTLDAMQRWLAADAMPGTCLAPVGDATSGLMLLADMPEAEDAAAGALFAGEAGRLLDRMLAAIGLSRAFIYLATVAPARPAGGRIDPAIMPTLIAAARRHAALAAPRRVLLLGDAPSRALLGTGFAEARGCLHALNYEGVSFEAVATFPPWMLLRQPAQKAHAWKDLRLFIEEAAR